MSSISSGGSSVGYPALGKLGQPKQPKPVQLPVSTKPAASGNDPDHDGDSDGAGLDVMG